MNEFCVTSVCQPCTGGYPVTETLTNLTAGHADAKTYYAGGSDALAPVEVLASASKAAGDVLTLTAYSGLSVTRVYQGNIDGSQNCPIGWELYFMRSNNSIVSQSPAVPVPLSEYVAGVVVPEDNLRILIGARDSSYFDNEGIRYIDPSRTTGGCDYTFQLIPVTCPP